MTKKRLRKKAAVKVYDVVMIYDSSRTDSEIEGDSIELLSEINDFLKNHFPKELPQFYIHTPKNKKLKIGVIPEDEEDPED